MDYKGHDQLVDEHYSNQDSPVYYSESNESPYRPSVLKSPNNGLVKKVTQTDDICDDENFEEDMLPALCLLITASMI